LIDLRDEVKNELVQSNSRMSGYSQWRRLDVLNRYLKGFRPGELTVVTGGTGYGKTTFLCEYSMDLFSQGIRTLFCSFEMPDEKILKWMM
jgi:twinkle protein